MSAGIGAQRRVTGSSSIVGLCAALILFDGYDLIVYGNVVPALLQQPGWGLTPPVAGRIAALTLVGMAIGALAAGTAADRIGRRRVVLASATVFSVGMALCALAPSLGFFAVARFVSGLGLGALFPLVTAIVVEFAPAGRRAIAYSLAFFGYLVGGIAAAALALALLEPFGWRVLFWIGALPLLVLPLVWRLLPESLPWLVARGRHDEAAETARRHGLAVPTGTTSGAQRASLAALFTPGNRLSTVLVWAVEFCGLLLVFGMVTWLPTIMVSLDYSLGFALAFVLALNAGAALGAVLASRVADRIGPRPLVVGLFALGAVAVAVLSTRPPAGLVFVVIAVAGAGTLGTQILTNVLVASLYPAAVRATGLGTALSVGRGGIAGPAIGGALLASTLGAEWNFYLFATVGALGALLAAIVPMTPAAVAARDELRAPVTTRFAS